MGIWEAIEQGDCDFVKDYINNGGNVNLTYDVANIGDYRGVSMLFLACMTGNAKIAELLIKNGANLNFQTRGRTIFFAAACGGVDFILRDLIKKGIDVDALDDRRESPLLMASSRGRVEAVTLLLESGADPNIVLYFHNTPLHYCGRDGNNVEIARLLIEHGADVNAVNNNGESPLFTNGSLVCEELLENNAKLDIRNKSMGQPMHDALFGGEFDKVKLFINYGADLKSISNYHGSVLECAVHGENPPIIDLLIDNGVDIDTVNMETGQTALHVASLFGKIDSVRTLLGLGARTDIKDKKNRIALDIAENREVRNLFIENDPNLKVQHEKRFIEIRKIIQELKDLGYFSLVAKSNLDLVVESVEDNLFLNYAIRSRASDSELYYLDRRIFHADSEDLAEGGMIGILDAMWSSFLSLGVEIKNIKSSDKGNKILVNDKSYEVFNGDIKCDSWLFATLRLLQIVNDILRSAGVSDRLYVYGEGNDTHVVLLTPELYNYIDKMYKKHNTIKLMSEKDFQKSIINK